MKIIIGCLMLLQPRISLASVELSKDFGLDACSVIFLGMTSPGQEDLRRHFSFNSRGITSLDDLEKAKWIHDKHSMCLVLVTAVNSREDVIRLAISTSAIGRGYRKRVLLLTTAKDILTNGMDLDRAEMDIFLLGPKNKAITLSTVSLLITEDWGAKQYSTYGFS